MSNKQSQLKLYEQETTPGEALSQDYRDWLPLRVTPVFKAYWRFACERQAIYCKRLRDEIPPWTSDPILMQHKFTNVYRASDRVSQFLIKHVIYAGDPAPSEVFFRIVIFKIFNKIETWKLLVENFGNVSWKAYDFNAYDTVLSQAMEAGERIFSAAYIMPSGNSTFGFPRKHSNYLKLVELMMRRDTVTALQKCRVMRSAFELLKSYPMLGDFLAYQLVTDINYSELTNFSENEFVVAGPGAKDGISKCFSSTAGLSHEEIIKLVQKHQQREFARLGLNFEFLGDRLLQLIDCQNLFCEISKYARVAFPEVKGLSDRHRIKQKFQAHGNLPAPWFPPKWEINKYFTQGVKPDVPDHGQ